MRPYRVIRDPDCLCVLCNVKDLYEQYRMVAWLVLRVLVLYHGIGDHWSLSRVDPPDGGQTHNMCWQNFAKRQNATLYVIIM